MTSQPVASTPANAPNSAPSQPQTIDSRQLLGEKTTVDIEHAGQRYQLRVTRENKLILTK